MSEEPKSESRWKRIPPTPERRALAARLRVLRQMNGWKQEEDARLMSIRDNLHYLAVNRR